MQRLYLFTLEVDELIVGMTYNPLPAHLTLVSRFYSPDTPDKIAKVVSPIFNKTPNITLLFEEPVSLGPKQTAAYLIKPSNELLDLHGHVVESLRTVHGAYTNPQYVRDGWKPHVSKRADNSFHTGDQLIATTAYLIEVIIDDTTIANNQVRHIRNKFNLAA